MSRVRLYSDNKTIYIVENDMFYERTKYIKIDCHIVCKKFEKNIIVTKYVT